MLKVIAFCYLTLLGSLSALLQGQDFAGEIENPGKQFGEQANLRMTNDGGFGWKTGTFAGNLDLNGHRFTMNTGGGNKTTLSGVLTGEGTFIWNGGGSASWQTTPSFISGTLPNSLSGALVIRQGTLAFAKPAGVTAFNGKKIILGGGSNQAILQLNAPHQIADACSILIDGKHEGRIWTNGNSEVVGSLALQSFGYLDLGDAECQFSFADSHDVSWDADKTLTIQNWTAGKDVVRFGKSNKSLTAKQISQIGFEDPSGASPGLYTARILSDGQVVPDQKVVAISPPFDVSDEARAKRRLIYGVAGLERLSGHDTPLRDGMTISFFGDSITWQNAYIRQIQDALKNSESTKAMNIRLVNRGINGGGVLSIRDGVKKAAYVDAKNQNGEQEPFASVIAKDHSDVAIVFIGINDVWWRKTSPDDFEQALRDLVSAAKENGTAIVLATLSVYQERPDGSNPMDVKCEAFAEITRRVAKSTQSTLVDLRSAFVAYLQNENAELRVDGSLNFLNTGVLTYDGVHPNSTGNRLIAEHLSKGIFEALQSQPADDNKKN